MITTTELIENLRWQIRDTRGQVPVTMSEAADFLEAQAKQIEELNLKLISSFGETQNALNRVEALQADAERYRLGREAEYAGLMPRFRTGQTWAEAMDAVYDAYIAARKGETT